MRVVWKFPIGRGNGWNRVEVKLEAKPVLVALDPATGFPAVWIEHVVDRGGHPKERWFGVFGTGEPVPESAIHVGSVIDGPFVWHVYEDKR